MMDQELQEVFRQSMRRLATTVSVLTCLSEGRRYGITATAVTSLCAEPASVLVCINAGASIAEPLLREGSFCVNLLQSSHAMVSTMFGGGAKGEERFSHGDWDSDAAGVPFLADAQANLFCGVDGTMAYGTHKIIVGRVRSGRFAADISPLIYQNGGYAAATRLAA